MVTYFIVFALLIALELCYFKIVDHYNIIDKPNERSSHKRIVLRGGGMVVVHWIYLVVMAAIFVIAYVLFMMKYYHLHEKFLASLEK